MVEHEPRTAFQELWEPVSRVRGAGARLAERIRRTAESYRAEDPLARLTADARGVQDQILRHAERALRDMDEQRARIVNLLERQTARLVAQALKRLNLATEAGVEELHVRVAECERRLREQEVGLHPSPREARRDPIDGDRAP